MQHTIDPIVSILGVILICAFLIGKVARKLKIPKVTGFIFVGVILGPSVFHVIDHDMEAQMSYLSEIALGLILFNIGGEFHSELLKKIGWKMVRYGIVYCGFMVCIVSSVCFILAQFSDLRLPEAFFYSCTLGMIAMTAAPPTTLLVLKEYDSKGTLTDHIIVILAIGTVGAIVGSQALRVLFESLGILENAGGDPLYKLGMLVWSTLGAVMVGTFLGLGLSFFEQREKSSSEVLLGVVCAILFGLLLSHHLKLQPLLLSMFLGFSLVNFSHSGAMIHTHVKNAGLSIYALFFIMAGLHIDVSNMLKMGLLGFAYIIARTLGVIISTRVSCKLLNEKEVNGKYLGLSLLSHGGVALGIISELKGINQSVVLITVQAVVSSIFFFELLGPIILRQALIKAGEVKVASLLGDASTGVHITLLEMVQYFLQNLGITKRKEVHETDSISTIMLRKIYAVDAKATFSEVVKYMDEHHFPVYPVVNEDKIYEGMIDLKELKNVMFDTFLSRFVVARDLIGDRVYISQDASLEDATEKFKEVSLEALPVIDLETGKLVGILQHKDVIMALRK